MVVSGSSVGVSGNPSVGDCDLSAILLDLRNSIVYEYRLFATDCWLKVVCEYFPSLGFKQINGLRRDETFTGRANHSGVNGKN